MQLAGLAAHHHQRRHSESDHDLDGPKQVHGPVTPLMVSLGMPLDTASAG
jgi:hypothetical protein